MLQIANLHKSYGDRPALRDVSLSLEAGEIVGLLGPNGAGKTTLASIIVGLIAPDSGTVIVDGVDATRHPGRARRVIGFAPQQTGVYEALTVDENLVFFGELCGLRRGALRRRIAEVCGSLLLDELRPIVCQRLSGGEKRRVHTAIAVLARPRLLLLDEPTVGADMLTRTALLDVVRQLADDGTAVLYSTHYLPEVESMNASVALLDRGEVIAEGRAGELVALHGVTGLELKFDSVPPDLEIPGLAVERDGDVVRILTSTPSATAARVLPALGVHAERLVSLDLMKPSLEGVFLKLTGRRFDPVEGGVHVAQS
jgi:ABC-2 type transport system ATP-binding protein